MDIDIFTVMPIFHVVTGYLLLLIFFVFMDSISTFNTISRNYKITFKVILTVNRQLSAPMTPRTAVNGQLSVLTNPKMAVNTQLSVLTSKLIHSIDQINRCYFFKVTCQLWQIPKSYIRVNTVKKQNEIQ
jgi:hypothetical protein